MADSADTDHKAAEERVRAFVARATENLADPNWRPSRASYEAARNHCSATLSRLSEVEGERDTAHAARREAEALVDLARELVSPRGMVNRGTDRGLVVVERADKTDPHYRLCKALEAFDKREDRG